MRFIRTKDGRIIDLKNWSRVETTFVNAETDEAKKDICYQRTWFEQHGDACEYKTEYISHNGQVLSQADTIEELCDEIVIVENGSHSIPAYIEEAINRFMEDCEFGNNNIQIYGAIWTDKGLIYAAKMNEKGELELI